MHRTLHLIDIENLSRGEDDLETLTRTSDLYRQTISVGPNDQIVVGTGAGARRRLTVGLLWPGARKVAQSGRDGADLALLGAAEPGWIIGRKFGRVVIASGDGIFADLAESLRAAGIEIVVVARSQAIHWRLYTAATRVQLLPASVELAAA